MFGRPLADVVRERASSEGSESVRYVDIRYCGNERELYLPSARRRSARPLRFSAAAARSFWRSFSRSCISFSCVREMVPRTLRLDSLDFRVARASSPDSPAGTGFSED